MAPSNLQLTLELKPISPRVYMGWNPERWIESYVSTSHAARSWPRFWLCSLEILDGYTILLGPRPTRHLSDASISSNLHCCVSSHRRPKPRHPHHKDHAVVPPALTGASPVESDILPTGGVPRGRLPPRSARPAQEDQSQVVVR